MKHKERHIYTFYSSHTHGVLICVYLIVGCICMAILPYLNRIPHGHHFLIVCHKMHTSKDEDKVANAYIQINTNDNSSKSLITFSLRSNDSLPVKPTYETKKYLCERETNFNRLYQNLFFSPLSKHILTDGDVVEVFHVTESNVVSDNLGVFNYEKADTKNNKIVNAKRNVLLFENTQDLLLDELFTRNILERLREEQTQFPIEGYDFDKNKTVLSSSVLISELGTDSLFTTLHSSESQFRNIKSFFSSLFSPFDISKEIISVGILTEAIDTIDLKIVFDENVKFSNISNDYSIIDLNSYTFISSYKDRKQLGFDKRLYHANFFIDNIEYTENCKALQNNSINFFVEKKESQKIQWVRQSLLSLVIGHCIISFIIHVFCLIRLKRWLYPRKF